jgi:hypothetical protein
MDHLPLGQSNPTTYGALATGAQFVCSGSFLANADGTPGDRVRLRGDRSQSADPVDKPRIEDWDLSSRHRAKKQITKRKMDRGEWAITLRERG